MTARRGVVATYEWTVPGARSLEHRERVERALADARGARKQTAPKASMILTADRWKRARDVLHHAMQMDEEKRSDFLDGQCASDPSLG